jgi:signal transduction histidine kinase
MKTPVAVSNLILQRVKLQEIEIEEAYELLQEENVKLSTALDNILELQRFEEAVTDYQPRTLTLESEVKDLINQNRSLFIQNHVFPKLICEETSSIVLADLKWNRVMLQQLISNAVKYSWNKDEERNSKYLIFEIKKLLINEKQVVELQIRDEGIGIPTYDLNRVFEPFYTGDNGRKCYNSSGIGLYLCKEISKLLGTKLEISSKVLEGTTVSIQYLTKL